VNIKQDIFGKLPDGNKVYIFTLSSDGITAKISNFGATLISLTVPDKNNKLDDIVLGYKNLEGYIRGKFFFGGTIGRNANRIKNAEIEINGKKYNLTKNEGENQLHGGIKGFNKALWTPRPYLDSDGNQCIELSYLSKDGEEGYPGNLKVKVKQMHLDSWQQGWVVSAVLLGAVLGAAIIGPMSDKYGRRKLVLVSSVIFFVGALGSAFSPEFWTLILSRIVLGMAVGASSALIPTYLAELSPAEKRGSMSSLFQLMVMSGILLAYITNYSFSGFYTGWRWMLGFAAIPAAILFFGAILLPESPRFLVKEGKSTEARDIYIAFFSATWGPVMWVMIGEIFPLNIRGLGNSFSSVVNWGANMIVSLTFPPLLNFFGTGSLFIGYGIICFVAIWFVKSKVFETRNRSLEEIESNLRKRANKAAI
jgi:MFS family permease